MVSPDAAAMYASNAQTCQSNTDLTDGSAGEPLEVTSCRSFSSDSLKTIDFYDK